MTGASGEASGSGPARILVIKLGALGDFVQALGPMAAIRRHHADAHVTLLTTRPFVELAAASGYADDVWVDERPGRLDLAGWLRLRRRLRAGGFARVYDLQTSSRSGRYFRLFWPGPRPEWSGIARGCSHPHRNPDRDRMHTVERQADQLRDAGIAHVPAPDLSWATADVAGLAPDRPFALLCPGGAPHRPAKRWPAERYGELAQALHARGLVAVLIGTPDEAPLLRSIAGACPAAVDLGGRTSLLHLAGLGRHAACAVGNDTGPMHLIAAVGCPSVVLFSHASDPALCGQQGGRVAIVRRGDLGNLGADEVLAALDGLAPWP